MIEIVLAGAPMGKERVRFVKATGRTFTPERTVNYEGRLALAGQGAMAGRPLLIGPLAITVDAYMPIPASKPKKWQAAALSGEIKPTSKPDIDNICKAACDALNLVVWADDATIVRATLSKQYSDRPRLELRAWELNDQGVFS